MYQRIFSFLLTLCLCGFLSAQSGKCDLATYNDFIAKGQSLVQIGDYIQAFEYYNSAKDYCPEKGKEVDGLVQGIIAKIAEDKRRTEEALAKAEKLVNAFYFHEDRFALACQEENGGYSFYFIDKEANPIEKLGKWGKLEQFGRNGFARAQTDFIERDYLIDTSGNKYALCTDPTFISADAKILFLSKKNISEISIPKISEIERLNHEEMLSRKLVNAALEELEKIGEWLFKGAIFTGYSYDTLLDNSQNGIQWIDLSSNLIEEIPQDVFYQEQLRILDLSKNKITNISGIDRLANISLLDISHNKIKVIPNEIDVLTSLKILDLGSNNIGEIPETVSKLTALKALDLTKNKIVHLPDGFGGLSSLNSLDLSENGIKTLPSVFGKLSELTTLNLRNNNLQYLPFEVEFLKNLNWMDLSFNNLSVLPPQIGKLENLTILYLHSNQLSSLPPEIGQLKNLEHLNLVNNPITEAEQEKIRQWLPNCEIEF